jgi:hypothetical protein
MAGCGRAENGADVREGHQWSSESGGPQSFRAGVKFRSKTPSAALAAEPFRRDVAQPGRALAWGARGRQFKSARPDQFSLGRWRSNRNGQRRERRGKRFICCQCRRNDPGGGKTHICQKKADVGHRHDKEPPDVGHQGRPESRETRMIADFKGYSGRQITPT